MFREWQVRRVLGHEALIVEADLTRIDLEAKSSPRQRRLIALDGIRSMPGILRKLARRVIWETGAFDFDDDDIDPQPIDASATYRRMTDIWTHRDDPEQSVTWHEIETQIAQKGRFSHKNYEIKEARQIPELIEACYLDLLHSMAEHGYMPDKKATFATAGVGLAMVGKSGQLISGPAATHRKAAARIAGVQGGFPLRIAGAHRDWLVENGITHSADLNRLPTLLQSVGGVVSASIVRQA